MLVRCQSTRQFPDLVDRMVLLDRKKDLVLLFQILFKIFTPPQAPTFYSLNADIAAAAAAANENREGRNLDVEEITDLKNIGGKQGKSRKFSG